MSTRKRSDISLGNSKPEFRRRATTCTIFDIEIDRKHDMVYHDDLSISLGSQVEHQSNYTDVVHKDTLASHDSFHPFFTELVQSSSTSLRIHGEEKRDSIHVVSEIVDPSQRCNSQSMRCNIMTNPDIISSLSRGVKDSSLENHLDAVAVISRSSKSEYSDLECNSSDHSFGNASEEESHGTSNDITCLYSLGEASTSDSDQSASDYMNYNPHQIIALGLLVTGSSDSRHNEGMDDYAQQHSPSRMKTKEELNQEAIDEALAGNFAINDHNVKAGKKSLLDVDVTTVLRRFSSRIFSSSKNGDLSSPKSSRGTTPKSQSPKSNTIDFQYLNSPPLPDASSPVYGTLPLNDLLLEDKDESSEELSVHPGLPLSMGPGAYFMPGPNASDRLNSDTISLGSLESDSHPPDPLSNEQNILNNHFVATVSPAAPSGSRLVVNGELVGEEDGLTEEERKTAIAHWRYVHIAIVLSILLLTGMITAIVFTISSTNRVISRDSQDHLWQGADLQLDTKPQDDNLFFGTSVSLSGSGTRLATGIPGMDTNITNIDVGQVQIFDLINGTWKPTAKLSFDSGQGKAGKALALSQDGNRVIVGSPFWSDERGLVSVFEERGEGSWGKIGNDLMGQPTKEKERFGESVAISSNGEIVAIGSPFAPSISNISSGMVRVFKEINSRWVQRGQDLTSSKDHSYFGGAIAMSSIGHRIAIGSTYAGFDTGQVTVYEFNGTHWVQLGQVIEGMNSFESFGSSVAISASGDILALGALGSTGLDSSLNAGKVQVFALENDEWVQLGNDILGEESEFMGSSLALSENKLLVVGCPFGGLGGRVKIFQWDDTSKSWIQAKLSIDGSKEGESFGFSVSISKDGRMMASGAPLANYDGGLLNQVGAVRTFEIPK
jgi:hypothetical protein